MKKLIALLIVLALTACLFVGCSDTANDPGTPSSNGGSSNNDPKPTDPNTPSEPVEIEFWIGLSGAYGEAIQAQVDAYNASQDKVHVTVVYQGSYNDCATATQAAIMAGNQPNLVQLEVSKVAPFQGDGALLDLTPFIEAENYDMSDFYEGLMSFSYGSDGHVYSMPFNRSTFILYYNADLFAEKGLSVPTNWTELAQVGKAVTDPANKMWGLTAPEQGIYLELWVMQLGGVVLNEDESDIGYNNDIGLKAMQFLRGAVDDGWYQAASGQEFVSNDSVRTAFINKNVAMLYSSSGDITTLQNSCDFTVGTAILPAADGRAPVSTTGGANIAALAGHSEEENAATWDFIKYLVSSESTGSFAQSTGYLPVRKSVMDSPDWKAFVEANPNFATPAEMLNYCVGRPYNYNYTTFYYTYENNALAKVVSSESDRPELQEILDELSTSARAVFAG